MTAPKTILYFLLALALIRGIIYASVIPPWQAPDEPAHFERAKASLNTADWNSNSAHPPAWYDELARSLFNFNIYDFLDTPRQIYSAASPINRYITLYQEAYGGLYGSRLTYALMGWPLLLTGYQDITLQLYLLRLNTVLLNVGIIGLAYLITKTLFPQDPFLYFGTPLLILFNPQHTHIVSTVNNGNLAELLATAALYFIVSFIVRSIIKGFSWLNVLLMVSFSLAAMWTKATAYFLPFAISIIGLFYLWRYRRHWRWLGPGGVILIGLIYFLAPTRLNQVIAMAWGPLQSGSFYLDPVVPQDLFRSFWAMPGWTIFQLHPWWYQLLLAGCLLAIFGLVILAIKKRCVMGQHQAQLQALVVLMVAIVTAIGILLAWNGLTHSIVYRQGRSIYPVIVPIYIFLLLGWRQFIPTRWRKMGLLAFTIAIFLFDTMVLFHYALPFFYSRY
jgi:hypothetical protein